MPEVYTNATSKVLLSEHMRSAASSSAFTRTLAAPTATKCEFVTGDPGLRRCAQRAVGSWVAPHARRSLDDFADRVVDA